MRAAELLVIAIVFAAGTPDASAREPVRIAEGVYMLAAISATTSGDQPRRANAAFVVGPRGVAVVDTGMSYAEGVEILAAVRGVTSLPVRLAILTQPEQAVIFGAAAFQQAGIPVLMHAQAAALMASRCEACLAALAASLGSDAMAGTRVVVPDRLVAGGIEIDAIGRRLTIIAPPWSSAPGALAVLDERSSTLLAGNLVSIRAVPDTRDADFGGWQGALRTLAATHCRHLVPSYGAAGRCSDIAAFMRYFSDLDDRVASLLRAGTSLADLGDRCDLTAYRGWQRYDELHRANAARAYLRLEKAEFGLQ